MTDCSIVFMGTPDFAAAVLNHIAATEGCHIDAVYTQPDRPAGRGHHLRHSPVKELALSLHIPVFQPESFRGAEGDMELKKLKSLKPDLVIVAAYGLILPQTVLDVPKFGSYNVHASLLPKYRGAAPIQRALMNGDCVTGITIMHMEKGLDTGPIVMQRALAISQNDTAETLHDRLADLGGKLMSETVLFLLKYGQLAELPQDSALATYADKITPADGIIHWEESSSKIHATVRAVTPWPGARTVLHLPERKPMLVKIVSGKVIDQSSEDVPGTLLEPEDGLLRIVCGQGIYGVASLRPAGGKTLSAGDFWNGYCRKEGKKQAVALTESC
ncbi:MAG: methionyl-tRNA formyltransferase [Desulfovibrionaceae bacterium]|nr:methionyl-tRNA formyltransferase [Desulfovibrionaceae bacterium]